MTYVAGSFSITKATATVTAHDGTKAYGASDPALTRDGDRLHDGRCADDRAERRPARRGEAVGDYVTTATATGAALTNYTVTYVAGSFSITKAHGDGDGAATGRRPTARRTRR